MEEFLLNLAINATNALSFGSLFFIIFILFIFRIKNILDFIDELNIKKRQKLDDAIENGGFDIDEVSFLQELKKEEYFYQCTSIRVNKLLRQKIISIVENSNGEISIANFRYVMDFLIFKDGEVIIYQPWYWRFFYFFVAIFILILVPLLSFYFTYILLLLMNNNFALTENIIIHLKQLLLIFGITIIYGKEYRSYRAIKKIEIFFNKIH